MSTSHEVSASGLEDARGVDAAEIRELLKLSPAQRVQRMVDAANKLLLIKQRARSPKT